MRHQRSFCKQSNSMALSIKKYHPTYTVKMQQKKQSAIQGSFHHNLVEINQNFSIHLWDRLLPQAESTLRMWRTTNIAPWILVYPYMYGHHNFNRMPLAPLRCTVLLHNKPAIRKTWENHTSEGYYIEMSREHYRCYKIWSTKIRSTQVADTVFFKHHYITMPTVSKADKIVVAANKIIQVLRDKTEISIGATEQQQLNQLAEVFQKVAKTLNKKEAEKPS